MQKFFRNAAGDYIGSFDGATPPAGSVECTQPNDGREKWQGDKWALPATEKLKDELSETESLARVSRTVEEILDHLENGTPISQHSLAWLTTRKGKRG